MTNKIIDWLKGQVSDEGPEQYFWLGWMLICFGLGFMASLLWPL